MEWKRIWWKWKYNIWINWWYGKIKEYDNGKLGYEGEYLKGEKNGKGKIYYSNGNILFDGDFLKGKKMEKEKNIILMEI